MKKKILNKKPSSELSKTMVTGNELAHVLGVQLVQIQQQTGGGKVLGGSYDIVSKKYLLGHAVSAWINYREAMVKKKMGGDVSDIKAAVEREKVYYLRQKRMSDRVRVKKAVATAMHEEMVGVIAEIRSMIKSMGVEEQRAIAEAMDKIKEKLSKVNTELAARNAIDTLPDADIEHELAAEMDDFEEEEDTEEVAEDDEHSEE